MMIISVRSSGKYAGSVMAVEVVKERTIETRQDVSFIRQPPPDKEAALDTFNLFLIIIVVIIMIVVTVTIALSAFCQESTGMALINWAHAQAAMKTRKERNSIPCNDPLITNYFYLKVSEAETLRPKPRCYKLSRKSVLF